MSETGLTNEAAWLNAKGAPLNVGPSDLVTPQSDEILIKNHAWAINPIDGKIQDLGIFIDAYPVTLGADLVGEVVMVGEHVSKFRVGDRVIAVCLGSATKNFHENAFQRYTIVPARCATTVPETMPDEEAVKLPVVTATAAAGLYEVAHLSLPLPTSQPSPFGKTLLIWGASSNVGAAAVQLAVASGVEVVATASKAYHELVSKMGASKIFEYSDPNVVSSLVEYLQGKTIAGVFDAIGTPETTTAIVETLKHFGGGKVATTIPQPGPFPAEIEIKQVQALTIFLAEPNIGAAVWEKFVPAALSSGQIRPVLKTKVVGKGLESIQAGLDEIKKGVSGTKLVVLA